MTVNLSADPALRRVRRVASSLVVILIATACGSGPIEPTRSSPASPVSPTLTGAPASQLSEAELLARLPRGSLAGLVVDRSGKPTAIGANVEAIGLIANYEPDAGVGYGVGEDGRFLIPGLATMTWTVSINDLTKERTDPRFVMGTATVVVRGGQTARVTIVIDRP
jgi:hypothetical protein